MPKSNFDSHPRVHRSLSNTVYHQPANSPVLPRNQALQQLLSTRHSKESEGNPSTRRFRIAVVIQSAMDLVSKNEIILDNNQALL